MNKDRVFDEDFKRAMLGNKVYDKIEKQEKTDRDKIIDELLQPFTDKVNGAEKSTHNCTFRSVINCAFKRLPYVVVHKGKAVVKGRCFDYYKCSSFTLISLYYIHIRLCPTKEEYLNLPQGG